MRGASPVGAAVEIRAFARLSSNPLEAGTLLGG